MSLFCKYLRESIEKRVLKSRTEEEKSKFCYWSVSNLHIPWSGLHVQPSSSGIIYLNATLYTLLIG